MAAGNVAAGAMAVLSYFSILVLVPIFAGKKSRYASYHANQGFVLFLLLIAWNLLRGILSTVTVAIMALNKAWAAMTYVSTVSMVFGLIGTIFCVVLAIFGIINCCKGRMKELPIIGKIKILKKRI